MLAAAGVALLTLAIVAVAAALRSDGVLRPDDPCASPPPMQTYRNVRLQAVPMRAFKRAEQAAGTEIMVIESYRSCAKQRTACAKICKDPNGCPGRCAPPGTSYHQLGAAIDVSAAMLQSPRVIEALEEEGWCQSLPESDPGHFTFGGCH